MFQKYWDDNVHKDFEQQKRQKSACDKKLTPVRIDKMNSLGCFKTYETSLISCTCRDFILRNLPCKHMYRLAHELELFILPFVVQSSETAILISTNKQIKVLDKSTGEIILHVSKDEAINNLDTLSPIALKILKDVLHSFVYGKFNEYFLFNKSVASELIDSQIVISLQISAMEKLDYAHRTDLQSVIKLIDPGKLKNLNPRALTKTIRKFISTNLVDEINQLNNELFVLSPNPHLQDYYVSIYKSLFSRYQETKLCYECYIKENNIKYLNPNNYLLSSEVYCLNCNNICDGLIRVLNR